MRLLGETLLVYLLCSLVLVLLLHESPAEERSAFPESVFAREPLESLQHVPELEARRVSSALTPVRLYVPKLKIDAPIEHVGKNNQGNMAVPGGYDRVAWYMLGSRPGEEGSAVLAAHLDNSLGMKAVFAELGKLEVGDIFYVEDKEGQVMRFRVTDLATYDYDYAPTHELFRAEGDSIIRLITCDGAWNADRKSYQNRLVVSALPERADIP